MQKQFKHVVVLFGVFLAGGLWVEALALIAIIAIIVLIIVRVIVIPLALLLLLVLVVVFHFLRVVDAGP